MKITKFGHSCMLVEEREARILFDPGIWSSGHKDLRNLDVLLITHEHPDHLDIESIKIIKGNNPGIKIFTNRGVGKILSGNAIDFELLENGNNIRVKNVLIEAFGEKHAIIYPTLPVVDDTGYMIAERFFYAGDALHVPPKPVEIFAMTGYAPWGTLEQLVDQVKAINPKICFPVHDGLIKTSTGFYNPVTLIAKMLLKDLDFRILEEGKENNFS